MAIHQLKTWPEPFRAAFAGHKAHEIRRDDRGFAVGDTLVLMEYDPATTEFSGRALAALVTYLTRGPDWGLPDGLCVMSIQPIRRYERSESMRMWTEKP